MYIYKQSNNLIEMASFECILNIYIYRANIALSSMLPMTTGEIETNLHVRTLETSRTVNKTLCDVLGLACYLAYV